MSIAEVALEFTDPRSSRPIRATLFGLEHLEAHAKALATSLEPVVREAGRPLMSVFRSNARALRKAHAVIGAAYRAKENLGAEAEWLLDNFHIVAEAIAEIFTDLPHGYYELLPKLAQNPLAGYPRIYAVALELTAHSDSSLDEANIVHFIRAFQTIAPLTVGELWAFPIMLRLCLIDNLRRLADHILEARHWRRHAHNQLKQFLQINELKGSLTALENIHPDWRDCFLYHLLEGVRGHALRGDDLERWDNVLIGAGHAPADVLGREKQRQAANQVSIGNCVTSLRFLATLDWTRFFEQTSLLEAVLRDDPAGVYARQDFATRDRYRQIVEELARGAGQDEFQVARRLVALARSDSGDNADSVRRHIGYFLIDDGKAEFERMLGYRAPPSRWLSRWVLRHPRLLYFGGLFVLGVTFAAVLGWLGWRSSGDWLLTTVLCLLALTPLSELAVGVMNWLVPLLVSPRRLPHLDFGDGIPVDCATFVVIPGLLASRPSATDLVGRLEVHYLANPDDNLYFCLLSDYTDAPQQRMPEDESLVRAAISGIAKLNEKYAPHGPPRFFLFHRPRRFNEQQGCWMGWERKRGKLAEFNQHLRGRSDSTAEFAPTVSGDFGSLPFIRFVITLDADTQIPRETARKLIATMAHPLNRPKYDSQARRVLRGYGVLQPRVSLSLRGARSTLFARIFGRSAGLDPYATAVSDTYQDLFGSGSFTGKGIYDVDAFMAATSNTFPENHILSHDLIEGNYARCGLVTDLELLDDFPTHYQAYARREHRWVRGDWQILPWMFARPPGTEGRDRANPLPLLERWKIADNLRRSLVAPFLLATLVLGWLGAPAAAWSWTGLALLLFLWPLVPQATKLIWRAGRNIATGRRFLPNMGELAATAAQSLLTVSFLPSQAISMVDAIGRTLIRLGWSRRAMLEWETAASSERRFSGSLGQYLRFHWPASALAVLIGAVLVVWHPQAAPAAAPFLVGWFLSPLIAWRISLATTVTRFAALTTLEEREARRLARKTWNFFETFVGPEDHWLPPDNFQENPKGEVAHRTSPTNIGLYLLSCVAAHDFGYLTFPHLLERLDNTLNTLDQLEQSHGHIFNWYDTQTLQPLLPQYISTVDSGNLAVCLITIRQALLEKLAQPRPGPEVARGLDDTLDLLETSLRSLTPDGGQGATPAMQEAGDCVASLRSLLTGGPPTGRPEWLDKICVESARLREAIDRIAASIAIDLPELHHWLNRLCELARWRREELTWLSRAGDAHPEIPAEGREHAQKIIDATAARAAGMDFQLLYNRNRHLFAVGFNFTAGRLDNAHYDLLASEAALTSILALARGDVPRKHWFQLGRPLTRVGGDLTLLSWGGTMFEYLMPRLLLNIYPDTLLGMSQRAAVEAQIRYGRRFGVPWGISESAYSATDGQLNYQYQAFGVPALGLKRGLGKDLVIAPYAACLALMTHPRLALANLRRIHQEGGEGLYGLYEALDYTKDRIPAQSRSVVVKCFMAHHQGMILLSLANCVLQKPMWQRFHAEPMVRATELLLQEKIPQDPPLAEATTQESANLPAYHEPSPQLSRRVTTPHTSSPRSHLLASSRHFLMITSTGTGQSSAGGLAITRWREDAACDQYGQFFYLRDLRSQKRWSAGYQPLCAEPDDYEVTFAADKVEFRRLDDGIETRMEIAVSPENHAEVRRLTIANHNNRSRHIELTSYAEIVLAPQAADLAHPAFGKLFLETEYLPAEEVLLCRRRPRSPEEKPVWALQVLATDARTFGTPQQETDRARFLGRSRTPMNPIALDPRSGTLSGTTGPVLDPIFSFRRQVRVKSGGAVQFAFTTAVVDSREQALALADQYHDFHGVSRAFELAWAHSQVELRHLQLTAAETHLFQRLATHLIFASPALRAEPAIIARNRQGQSDLWRHGLSGDFPIVLVCVHHADELPVIRQLLAAHAFWRLKGLPADLVILNEESGGYFDELQEKLQTAIRASDDRTLVDKPAGVFIKKTAQLNSADVDLLHASARCVIQAKYGLFDQQLERAESAGRGRTVRPRGPLSTPDIAPAPAASLSPPSETLRFQNGIGGFSADGREYVMRLTHADGQYILPPRPWINVVANRSFGFLASESGGGCTWSENSQAYRLTPWRNDPVTDAPTEVLYVRDQATRAFWSATPLPCGAPAAFAVRHGHGYTTYEHERGSIHHQLTLFVPPAASLKVMRLRVRNIGRQPRRLTAVLFAEFMLGKERGSAAFNVVTELDPATSAILARNYHDLDFAGRVAFAIANVATRSVTTDRLEFLGRNGSRAIPAALTEHRQPLLSGQFGAALDPCASLEVPLVMQPGELKEIAFILGDAPSLDSAREMIRRLRQPAEIEKAWQETHEFWTGVLTAVQVRTPNAALDLLCNGWFLYQVASCRMWGRSALYQSSGAFGFRDQLQDCMALVYSLPQETRQHILRAASRQFTAGDVQHWWHPPSGAGVRTRFSDDFLWLPFVVIHYVATTGDRQILSETASFLEAPALAENLDEEYRIPKIADEKAPLYEHCVRAIENGLRFGAHGLPLMGTGDWNDGMNRVGREGRGESVWNAWFLLTILEGFAPLAEAHSEPERAARYRATAQRLKESIEEHAWDGKWYRRAYFDDGTPLGSASNDECRIDSLTQSWAVISGAADPERARQGMAAVDEMLVQRDDSLVELFAPPFAQTPLEPGYIKGYLAGIRENGGQYTHAATWVVQAFALLGQTDRAMEVLDLMNPIFHARTSAEVERFGLEPYVLPADVYSQPPHAGRGGWSWYTGSAGWLYRVILETILGFELRGDRLKLSPRIPDAWPGFEITYRRGNTTYLIRYENHAQSGSEGVTLDDRPLSEDHVPLVDDGSKHTVIIRKCAAQ